MVRPLPSTLAGSAPLTTPVLEYLFNFCHASAKICTFFRKLSVLQAQIVNFFLEKKVECQFLKKEKEALIYWPFLAFKLPL